MKKEVGEVMSRLMTRHMSDGLERGVGLACIILDWRLAVLNTKYCFVISPLSELMLLLNRQQKPA